MKMFAAQELSGNNLFNYKSASKCCQMWGESSSHGPNTFMIIYLWWQMCQRIQKQKHPAPLFHVKRGATEAVTASEHHKSWSEWQIWLHWFRSRSKGYVYGEQGDGFSLLCFVLGARWELVVPRERPGAAVSLCERVTSGLERVWEWRGGEFSGEDCAGRRAVSIIQGKHWAAWLHASDVTGAGRAEMDEMMRLLLACMPVHFCTSFLPMFCNISEDLRGRFSLN